MKNISLRNLRRVSYFTLEASEVDETGVGQGTRVVIVDAQEEVQSESGDHGGKELEGITTNSKGAYLKIYL